MIDVAANWSWPTQALTCVQPTQPSMPTWASSIPAVSKSSAAASKSISATGERVALRAAKVEICEQFVDSKSLERAEHFLILQWALQRSQVLVS